MGRKCVKTFWVWWWTWTLLNGVFIWVFFLVLYVIVCPKFWVSHLCPIIPASHVVPVLTHPVLCLCLFCVSLLFLYVHPSSPPPPLSSELQIPGLGYFCLGPVVFQSGLCVCTLCWCSDVFKSVTVYKIIHIYYILPSLSNFTLIYVKKKKAFFYITTCHQRWQ